MRRHKTAEGLKSGPYTLVSDDEELQQQPVYLVTKKSKDLANDLGGWGIYWQDAQMNIATDRNLTLTDHRVLAVLHAKIDFENWIRISQKEIGDFIGVARPNISVSMKKLVKMGVVVPGPSVSNVRTYRLNPAVAWKGTMQHGATERRKSLRVVDGGKKDDMQTITTDPNQLPLF